MSGGVSDRLCGSAHRSRSSDNLMEWRREREWGEKRDVRKRMDGTVVEIVRNDGKYADRQTDTQTDRYTDRQTDTQTDRHP